MPIETICKGCSRKLRVGDEHAGKKARCPQCGMLYTVPGSTMESTDDAPTQAAAPVQEIGWRLRTPDGRVYGPVAKDELDQWLKEGRITANCQLSGPGMESWGAADRVYAQLGSGTRKTTPKNPFADTTAPATNPFAVTGMPTATYQQPHRGGLILTLSILGWALCVVFAPFAWSMGRGDLRAMRAGQMDPRGMGLTQAGMIVGMVQTILMIVVLGIYLLFILIMVVANV